MIFAVKVRQNFDLKIREMKAYFLFSRDLMWSGAFDATSWRIKCIDFIVEKATVVFAVGDSSVEVEFVTGNFIIILKVLEMSPDILAGIQCCWDLTPWKVLKIPDLIKEISVSNAGWTLPVEYRLLLFRVRIWDLRSWAPWLLRDGLGFLTLCFLCEYCKRGRYLPCFVLVTSLLYSSLPPAAKYQRPSCSGSSATPPGISEAVFFESTLWFPLLKGVTNWGQCNYTELNIVILYN